MNKQKNPIPEQTLLSETYGCGNEAKSIQIIG